MPAPGGQRGGRASDDMRRRLQMRTSQQSGGPGSPSPVKGPGGAANGTQHSPLKGGEAGSGGDSQARSAARPQGCVGAARSACGPTPPTTFLYPTPPLHGCVPLLDLPGAGLAARVCAPSQLLASFLTHLLTLPAWVRRPGKATTSSPWTTTPPASPGTSGGRSGWWLGRCWSAWCSS